MGGALQRRSVSRRFLSALAMSRAAMYFRRYSYQELSYQTIHSVRRSYHGTVCFGVHPVMINKFSNTITGDVGEVIHCPACSFGVMADEIPIKTLPSPVQNSFDKC